MRRRTLIALGVVLAAVPACRSARSGLREWRPEDHDSGVTSGAAPAPSRPSGTSGTSGAPNELGAVRALYLTQCASCHGEEGRGDGPMGAMFRPPALGSQAVQAKSDEELTRVIAQGRNRMPAFGDRLPPDAYPLLVRLIRTFR